MNRLQKLSDLSFARISLRVYNAIEELMKPGEHTPGLFDQSWDWPTFGVLFPRKMRIWRQLRAESTRRGIKKILFTGTKIDQIVKAA